jgi:hypothetical protein
MIHLRRGRRAEAAEAARRAVETLHRAGGLRQLDLAAAGEEVVLDQHDTRRGEPSRAGLCCWAAALAVLARGDQPAAARILRAFLDYPLSVRTQVQRHEAAALLEELSGAGDQ